MIEDAELLALLRAEREARPDVAAVLDLHIALAAAPDDGVTTPPAETVARGRARLARGETAFRSSDVVVDWPAVRRRARAVGEIAARHEPEFATRLAQAADRLEEMSAEAGGRLVADWLSEPEAKAEETDGAALTFLLHHALRPTLRAHAAALLAGAEVEPWPRGRCPVCDGFADFAALEPDTGQRRLLCARCDTEWSYARTGCPRCGEGGEAGYYPAGAYRLYVCERCHRYLKTIDRRETWRRRPLSLERILTVGLDVAAAREGYRATA